MKTFLVALCLFVFSINLCPAQTPKGNSPDQPGKDQASATQEKTGEAQERLLIATSSIAYPVTPSDLYTLTYRRSTPASAAAASDLVTQTIQVAGDYSLDLGLFGKVNAQGLSFIEVKTKVESLVAESYARSYPSLTIEAVGIFRVGLGGSVARPRFINAWGLSRVSELVEAAGEEGFSQRSVRLDSSDGVSKQCDLLKASRTGDGSLDPIVRPGDAITLFPASVAIKISGEVRHAGGYELVRGEGLRDLVETFGGGLTGNAETSRIRIDRMTVRGPVAQYVSLAKAYDPPISLEGCIAVSIPSQMDNRNFIWFEGAINGTTGSADAAIALGVGSDASGTRANAQTRVPVGDNNRVSIQINEGEMLSDALRDIKNSIAPFADLSSASLSRQGSIKPIPVNLQSLLAMANPPSDIRLEPNDRIFIPTIKSMITVYGAVFAGGSFTYQPNSPASYYINMAGGVDPEKNGNGHYAVYDQNGKKRKATDSLMPNDRIYVPINSFTYNAVRYTPLISGIVTMVVVVVPFVQNYLIK
jgi:polysaccharide biosynthesis/export protein